MVTTYLALLICGCANGALSQAKVSGTTVSKWTESLSAPDVNSTGNNQP